MKHISKACYSIYKDDQHLKTELDSFSNGGKLDAFRHVFFMAAFAQHVKPKKLRKLGKAHEKGNYRQYLRSLKEDNELADSLGMIMDLNNNEIGFVIGSQNKKADLQNLKQTVISEIKSGKALIMKRRKDGIYLDCDGKPVVIKEIHSWYVPKCLVSSEFVYR
ncbi:MAG: hypothetical protein H0W61_05325 [Bacteroidetes bacterium]|nr:hypothetical protein [Bacteroidota bacterium]